MEKNSIKVLLVSLANMYSGNWDYMYKHIALNKKYNYEEALKSFSNIKSNVITIMDSDLYPKEFNQILHPPFVLFFYGNISLLKNKNKLAVIGSRQNTSYGKKVTEDILNDLHEKIDSLTIISGMAKGIDGIAMRTAIKNNDNVIAILGSGIDNPYPKENIDIYEYCKTSNKGLILSEYPLDTKPLKENFPIRNRLIAGLCDCVFVPEAKIKSGTSITIKYALDNGKEIFVAPNQLFSNSLNNLLLRDGANICISADDLLDSLTHSTNIS